ncbi:MAG: type II toxin-antitoxin system HipA family toxin [Bacteroidota bacterium]
MWPTSDGRLTRLVVFAPLAGESVPVGELVFEGRDRRQSFFRYAESWLRRGAEAHAVSPVLPLRRKAVLGAPYPLPLPFYDAAPDGWGRAVLNQAFPHQEWGMAEILAAAGSNRTGELQFGPDPAAPPEQFIPGEPLVDMPAGQATLEELLEAAEAVDAGRPRTHHLHLLYRSSADAGGARPKTHLLRDGGHWLAKFPALGDPFDDPRIEAACLDLAEACGIDTPARDLVTIAGRSVLLVRRFDRGPAGEALGYASAATLVGQPPLEYVTKASYAGLAVRARELGVVPCEAELFRRLLFNAFIHNTDDHLRNHAFIRRDGRWRLSPVFDLVPNARARLVLVPAMGVDPLPDPRIALAAHGQFGLDAASATAIYDGVVAGLAGLGEILDRREVSPRDRETLRTLAPLAFAPPLPG